MIEQVEGAPYMWFSLLSVSENHQLVLETTALKDHGQLHRLCQHSVKAICFAFRLFHFSNTESQTRQHASFSIFFFVSFFSSILVSSAVDIPFHAEGLSGTGQSNEHAGKATERHQ